MPKKLKVHPNERVDIPDFEEAAYGYTQESLNFHRLEFLASRRAQFLRGFRIELPNQASSPGEVTIHNGVVIDRDGELITDENAIDDSRTITLVGANLDFYLEVEFAEEDSDVDDRAIWDPTFDNGTATAGKEFVDNLTTRTTPTWKIVTPVSTSGFDSTTDPASTKAPLAILSTDGSGEITVAVNPGLVTEVARTTLSEPAAIGDTSVQVFDSVIFPTSGTVDIGGETVTLTGNDKERGILSFTGTPLAAAHLAGTIAFNNTGGAPVFIQENTTATIPSTEFDAATSTHPDKRRKFYVGDEERGLAVLASKVTANTRDETQIRTLKDRVDSLAAIIQEMKAGRVVSTQTIKPPEYTTNPIDTSYFDFSVGSIQGARTVQYTICDGVNNFFGDFIGTDQQPFQDAVDAGVAAGFEQIILHVKQGSYTFSSSVTLSSSVVGLHVIGEEGGGSPTASGSVSLGSSITSPSFSSTDAQEVTFKNIAITNTTTGTFLASLGTINATNAKFVNCSSPAGLAGDWYSHNFASPAHVELTNCHITADAAWTASRTVVEHNAAGNLTGFMRDCTFNFSGGGAKLVGADSGGAIGGPNPDDGFFFENVKYTCTTGGAAGTSISGDSMQNVQFRDCVFRSNASSSFWNIGIDASDNITIRDCSFIATGATFSSIMFQFSGAAVTNMTVDNCLFDGLSGGVVNEVFAFDGGAEDLRIMNSTFKVEDMTTADASCIYFNTGVNANRIRIDNCEFTCGNSILEGYAINLNQCALTDVYVLNNRIKGFEYGIRVYIDNPVDILEDVSRLVIDNNTIQWKNPATATSSTSVFGISVIGDGVTDTLYDVSITNNMINGVTTSASTVTGISFSAQYTAFNSVKIRGNTVSNLTSTSGSGNATGINVWQWVSSASVQEGAIIITDNVISDLDSAGNVRGIDVTQPTNTNRRPLIANNDIRRLAITERVSSTQIYGILCDCEKGAKISDNIITELSDSVISTGLVYGIGGIGVDETTVWTVTGNEVTTPRASLAVNEDNFRGVSLSFGTAVVNDNKLYSNWGIYYNAFSDLVDSFVASGNMIDCAGRGIYLTCTDVSHTDKNIQTIAITGNTIYGGTTDSETYYIYLDPGNGTTTNAAFGSATISGNNIQETVNNTLTETRGIWAIETRTLVISSNMIAKIGFIGATQAANSGRAGIFLDGGIMATISSNSIRWNTNRGSGNTTTNQAEIYSRGVTRLSISANSFRGSDNFNSDSTIVIENTGSAIGYTISGNLFDGSGVAPHLVLAGGGSTTGIPAAGDASVASGTDTSNFVA